MARLQRLLAAALLCGMAARAVASVDQSFDAWSYHLPFAARLAGLVGTEQYHFDDMTGERFLGFPRLAELLQGVAWRLTGRIQSANLVAFGSLLALLAYLWLRFEVSPAVATLAVLGIPLVRLHATICYVDLPAGVAGCVLVLEVYRLWAHQGPVAPADLLGVASAAAVSANVKLFLLPTVGVALAFAATAVFARRAAVGLRRTTRGECLAAAAALVVIFATPLRNIAVHANPVYPFSPRIGAWQLPGPEGTGRARPAGLESVSGPALWLRSLFEWDVPRGLLPPEGGGNPRWTYDQFFGEGEPGNRTGGFCGAYVALLLILLALRHARAPSRESRCAAYAMGLLSLVVAPLPQAYELRYSLYWMLCLVVFNVILARQSTPGLPGPRGLASLGAVAVVVALLATGGAGAAPSGPLSTRELSDAVVDQNVLARLGDGDRICVVVEPWSFLYAALFHPPRQYRVRGAKDPRECGDSPAVVPWRPR